MSIHIVLKSLFAESPEDILEALTPQLDTTETEFLRLNLLLLSQLLEIPVEADKMSLVETFGNIFIWGSLDLQMEMAEKAETEQTELKEKRNIILMHIAERYSYIY